MSSKFNLKQVAEKSTDTSGLIVIDKRVYDITDYMSKHPGGDDILTEVWGQDATEAFHEVGHSEDAKEQLKPLLVGELDDGPETKTKSASSGTNTALPRHALELAIAILALFIWAFFLRQ